MLRVIDIHTYYGESHVLHGMSLSVEVGSVVALLGRNGTGKTTTVHSTMGLAPCRSGSIEFEGRDITRLEPYDVAQLGIGLVPQGRRIFPSLSVKENLTMAARGGRGGGDWTLEKVFSLFPVLEQRMNLKGNLLSGGEQQMLTIGRALMTNPRLLLMDEPSEGLAPLIVRELGGIIRELHRSGLSILLVEQNLGLALDVADYVYIANKGAVVRGCTPRELESDKSLQDYYLGVGAGNA
ncbi:MAG: ABC transporter ATP-binding protein [Betaproteobacteria bacterium]|nr:ABC transporter ATP-binding protein [Betaproteobacteria bacterium]